MSFEGGFLLLCNIFKSSYFDGMNSSIYILIGFVSPKTQSNRNDALKNIGMYIFYSKDYGDIELFLPLCTNSFQKGLRHECDVSFVFFSC